MLFSLLYVLTMCPHAATAGMPELNTLNLNKNFISMVENISHQTKLQTLLLADNKLQAPESIEKVLECPSIATLDLKNNKLEVSQPDNKQSD